MKKKSLMVAFIIIALIPLIFIADNYFKSDYKDPFRVAKAFSYSYMTKNTKNMKSWASKKVYHKIDQLHYLHPVENFGQNDWGNFKLVCFRRLGDTIVSTCAYDQFEKSPFLYSTTLEPVGPLSLWEKSKDFIYYKLPLGGKLVDFPFPEKRWLVVDFFSTDEDAYEKHVDVFVNKANKDPKTLLSEMLIDADKAIEEVERRCSYENEWGKEEKVRQNEEMKSLYDCYKGLHTNNPEEHSSEKDGNKPPE
jgi:hypothetical protein